jgi:2-dehydro-3-deoxyglucarate aldolase/4-hydroxy-2-oxoheptanedioate aldolase
VNTEEQARRVVELSLYPPAGTRSLGAARAQGYGLDLPDGIQRANEQIAIIVQAEHVDAVENIESILSVEGIAAILIGPYDLSGSLGIPGQVNEPRVRHAIDHVTTACRKAGMPVGIFAGDLAAARQAVADGVNMIALGLDVFFLWQSASKALAELREAK